MERIILPTRTNEREGPRRFLQFYLHREKIKEPCLWCTHNLTWETGESELELITRVSKLFGFIGFHKEFKGLKLPELSGKNYEVVGSGIVMPRESKGQIYSLSENPGLYPLSVDDEHIKALNSYLSSIQKGWRRFIKA